MNLNYKKLTEPQLSDIVSQIKESVPYRKIGKQYKISLSTICRIKCEYLGKAAINSARNPRILIGEKEQSEIIELINQGISYRNICKQYNIPSPATIFRIKQRTLSGVIPIKRTEQRKERIRILFDSLPNSEKKIVLNILENSVFGNVIARDCRI
jgi:uncharacterized protein YerC